MNILLAINNLGTGGAESFFCRFARQLAEVGHEVWVWQLFYPIDRHVYSSILSHENIREFKVANTDIQHLVIQSKGLKSWGIKKRINNEIKNLGIQLVNSHLFETDYFVSSHIDLPHILSMHGSYEMYFQYPEIFRRDSIYRSFDFQVITRNLLSSVNHVVLASEKNKSIFNFLNIKVSHSKIYYGIQAFNANQTYKSEINMVGMLSRGLATKGWRIAIETCIRCHTNLANGFKLKLGYTSSPYMEKLKIEYSYLDWIEWIQNVDDSIAFFNSVDLLIFPTQYPAESLPNVVIESLNMGIPVFSTTIGDIPMMVHSDSGLAGYLLDYQMADEELIKNFADEIVHVIHDNKRYKQLRSNAFNASKKFKLSETTDQYVDLFTKVLNEK
jgi:glycosyltransferase involved in cell wall biosynthesis